MNRAAGPGAAVREFKIAENHGSALAVRRGRTRGVCGRIARTSTRPVIVDEFGVTSFANVDLGPRYNIAPTQSVESIIRCGDALRLGPMAWGFRSSAVAKRPSPINARSETVATSPLFRESFQRRRCLVVADGFYEWRADGARKRPYFIRLRSGRPFGLAGVWAGYRSEVGTKVITCAILTCHPNDLLAEIHNRMPVIVPPERREQWLDQRTSPEEIAGLLAPLPAEEMEAYEVSVVVNSARHDGPECTRPLDENRLEADSQGNGSN